MKITLTLFALLIFTICPGQSTHELKADLFMPIFKIIHLDYEYIPARKVGVEFGVFYQPTAYGYLFKVVSPGFPESNILIREVSQQILQLNLAAKYYFFSLKKLRTHFFAGLYCRRDWLLSADRPYYKDYDRLIIYYYFGSGNGGKDLTGQTNPWLGFGALAGFKTHIYKQFWMEVGIGMDENQLDRNFGEPEWGGFLSLKANYRFK